MKTLTLKQLRARLASTEASLAKHEQNVYNCRQKVGALESRIQHERAFLLADRLPFEIILQEAQDYLLARGWEPYTRKCVHQATPDQKVLYLQYIRPDDATKFMDWSQVSGATVILSAGDLFLDFLEEKYPVAS